MSEIDELLAPISEADPGGESLRYEPVYDEIKQARHEEPELPQGEWQRERKVADWPKVTKLCREALQSRSKDLQIAAWLTEAWLRLEGFAGLERGLRLLRGLQESFWEHLYPEIEEEDDIELRAAPLEWVGGRLEASILAAPLNEAGHGLSNYRLSQRPSGAEEEEEGPTFDEAFEATPKQWYVDLAASLKACLDELELLDDLCGERYGNVAPSFVPLRDLLEESSRVAERLLAVKREQDPDPLPAEEDAAEEGAGSGGQALDAVDGPMGAGMVEAPSPGDLKSWDDAAALLGAAAAFMRKDNPTSPAPYLVLRALRWGELRASGSEPDPRLMPAPPVSVRTKLKSLLLDGRWQPLLETAEGVMATPYGRGWLDLQRYVFSALHGLGEGYAVVTQAIRQALRGLIADIPKLPALTMMDDSPAANPETLAWLKSEILGQEPGEPMEAEGGSEGAAQVQHSAALARAMTQMRAGQPQKAVEFLMQAAAHEKSPRARFMRRSEASKIMVDEGMNNVATPLLREMMEQIEQHKLDQWESSEIVAQPMALLYRCLKRAQGDAGEMQNLYLRVCRLDPVEGMRLASVDTEKAEEPAPAETEGAGSA